MAFLERAARETKRGNTRLADLAFGAYIVARLVDSMFDRDETPDGQTGFRWQRDVTDKHVRQLPSGTPEVNHLRGIVEAVPVDGSPSPALAVSLTAYAYFLEHEGWNEEALDVLALSARAYGIELPTAEFAAYALFAARLNRHLTRWQRALVCYEATEHAGERMGDPVIVLRGRLGQGAVARGQGNLPKARTIAEEVAREATEQGLAQVQCMAYADLSAVYTLQELPLEAIRACYAAFLVATTYLDRLQALGNLGTGLAGIGAYDQARLALEIAAAAKTDFGIRINATIELMDLEATVGNRVAFDRHRVVVADCREQMPPSTAVDYHFKLGIGVARFGELAEARENLTLALKIAETHALNAWYFRIERALNDLSARPTIGRLALAPEDLKRTPLLTQVELGLREYASAARD